MFIGSIGRSYVTYRILFHKKFESCLRNVVFGNIDNKLRIQREKNLEWSKKVDQMKNMKEKWVTKRGLITILKGKEERRGGATEETEKKRKVG